MPLKLKKSARKSRRDRKIGIAAFIAILAVIIVGALYASGVFTSPIKYGLVVNANGSGSTNVTGIQTYDAGTKVAVQATPGSGMMLSEWLVNGTSVGSSNPYVVTMSENRNLTAVFIQTVKQGRVLLETSIGDITIELRDDKPVTSGNFKDIVERGLYDGTIFHRVMEGFMVQGGDVNVTLNPINDEIGSNNRNLNGTVAMANAGPNTATSGFFINVADNSNITYQDGTKFDDHYTVFGTVVDGMDVVMAISHVAVDDPSSQSPKPLQDVTLISATLLP